MEPWFPRRSKPNEEKLTPQSGRSGQFRLSIRSALLLLLALYVALADAVLQYGAHQPGPLIAISMIAVFIASHRFFDGLIE
jgi:hypothetical protein